MRRIRSSSPLLIDYRKGSKNLALYPPLRDLLSPCPRCDGNIGPSWKLNRSTGIYYNKDIRGRETPPTCPSCSDTGRVLSTLPSGDVSFIGNGCDGPISIGVEVKSVSELITSISNGRLQDTQIINGMVNDYDYCGRWLLHYGMYRPSPKDGTIQEWREGRPGRQAGWYSLTIGNRVAPYSYLESFKVSPLLLELGFHVVRVNDIVEAAHWIVTLYKEWAKPYHTHKSMNTLDRSQDPREMYRREEERRRRPEDYGKSGSNGFVKGGTGIHHIKDQKFLDRLNAAFHVFPSIGYEKAKAIAADPRFKTIMDMMRAAEKDQLADIEVEVGGEIEVEGEDGVERRRRRVKIGKVISRRIKEHVT